ncbi:MAG: nucleotide sugar dehydrogenase [Spirosomataceae bacterium]
MNDLDNCHIVVVGLGYVGLPLAVEFGKRYPTWGVDINEQRIKELQEGFDRTKELEAADLEGATQLSFTTSLNIDNTGKHIQKVYIVTVPTPIDAYKKPDLSPLLGASKAVGQVLRKGDIVIYESTVYPGCTEEDCVPVLERESGLVFNTDFYCGYSPERINPGDKENTLTKILKITSGSTPEIADFVDALYRSIIVAGTYKAPSMKVAEAAKIVENCQRDVNISFVNELALIFDKLGIDTKEVLDAAGTKWNFLKFKPGLVGGHCIGVDPYYMIHKSEQVGYYPAVIGAGRRVNDNMGQYVANKAIKQMIKVGQNIKGSDALILGFTFKENCPDIRNTKVIDIYRELNEFGLNVDVYDHWAIPKEVEEEYQIRLVSEFKERYNLVIVAVAHNEYITDRKFLEMYENTEVLMDLKSIIDNKKAIKL